MTSFLNDYAYSPKQSVVTAGKVGDAIENAPNYNKTRDPLSHQVSNNAPMPRLNLQVIEKISNKR